MATQDRGLGRGLDILFRNTREISSVEDEKSKDKRAPGDEFVLPAITKLPVAILRPSLNQPRKVFAQDTLEELAVSIKNQGVIQPILVRPYKEQASIRYEIVAGERRWRAAQLVGLTDNPAYVKELSDEDVLLVALVENLQREDLSPIEEAVAIASLQKKLSINQDELARKLGKSRSSIANTLRLLNLAPEIQEGLSRRDISSGHARALLVLEENIVLQQILYKAIRCQQLSVRDVESSVSYWKKYGVLPPSIMGMSNVSKKVVQQEKSEILKNIITTLRDTLHSKVTIAGSESMGRITISYESQTQFSDILLKLGMNVSDIIDT